MKLGRFECRASSFSVKAETGQKTAALAGFRRIDVDKDSVSTLSSSSLWTGEASTETSFDALVVQEPFGLRGDWATKSTGDGGRGTVGGGGGGGGRHLTCQKLPGEKERAIVFVLRVGVPPPTHTQCTPPHTHTHCTVALLPHLLVWPIAKALLDSDEHQQPCTGFDGPNLLGSTDCCAQDCACALCARCAEVMMTSVNVESIQCDDRSITEQ